MEGKEVHHRRLWTLNIPANVLPRSLQIDYHVTQTKSQKGREIVHERFRGEFVRVWGAWEVGFLEDCGHFRRRSRLYADKRLNAKHQKSLFQKTRVKHSCR